MDNIPVLEKRNFSENIYSDMKVLLVDNLLNLTEEYLENEYIKLKNKSNEKLKPEYWTTLILKKTK
jgi:hypothetical protein